MMKEPTPELWETIYHEKSPSWLIAVEQLAIAYANKVFTVTENLRQVYIQRGADAEKIRVMHNLPDPQHWLNIPSPEIHHSAFTLICHGTIEPRYGHDIILEALVVAKSTIPDIRLRIMGHGSKIADLKQKIRTLGLESSVDFLSWVSHEKLIAEIKAADMGIVGLKSSPYSNLIHSVDGRRMRALIRIHLTRIGFVTLCASRRIVLRAIGCRDRMMGIVTRYATQFVPAFQEAATLPQAIGVVVNLETLRLTLSVYDNIEFD
jgi:glycosyltransferase involved in cell wall biosynthesis